MAIMCLNISGNRNNASSFAVIGADMGPRIEAAAKKLAS